MKQFYLLLLFGVFMALKADAQAPRRVLVEEFTQASCPPCAAYNPVFHGIIFTPGNETKVGLVCYQTSWPGSDPMNAQNSADVQTRVNFYGVNAVPWSFADGGTTIAGDSIFHDNIASFRQTVIDKRVKTTSPLELTVNHTISDKLDSVNIVVTVKNVSSADLADNAFALQTLLIEKTIQFGNPPGTNGEREFFDVMRKMVPTSAGTKLVGLKAGTTLTYSFTIAMPSYIYSLKNIGSVVFVQSISKKEILQSAESLPKPLPTAATYLDLRVNSEVTGYTGWCDPNVGLKVNFFNDGTDLIKTVSVDLLLNNVKVGTTKIDTFNLTAGQSAVYEYKNINLKVGQKNLLNFRINNINGVSNNPKDIDKLNQTAANNELLSLLATPYAEEMHEAFEVSARGVLPTNCYAGENLLAMRVFPADKAWVAGTDDIGGFGASTFSLWWDFYFGPDNAEASLFYDKLDLSKSVNTHLSLSRAYAQLNNEEARFTVEASRDCGATWTTVYEKAGSDLASVGPIPSNYWSPLAGDWIRDTVPMTDFDGAAEVLIRLRGYNPPGWSNFLYVDDIDIAPLTVAVNTVDPGVLSGMSVYPNPASNELNLKIDSKEAINARVQLFDMNGRAVAELGQNIPLRAGVNVKSFKVDNYLPGLYSLKVSTDKGVRNSMISIN